MTVDKNHHGTGRILGQESVWGRRFLLRRKAVRPGLYETYPTRAAHMPLPKIDHRITLQKGDLTIEALCTEVLENPAQPEGILVKVLTREDFEEGEQCWLVDAVGARIGAIVQRMERHSGDRELTLAAMLPEDTAWNYQR